jgi:hypothetical protein
MCICAASEPEPIELLGILLTPDAFGICGGALVLVDSARNIRNIRSCDPVAAACPRGRFFSRYPISGPAYPKWGTIHSLCRAARRAAPQSSVPPPLLLVVLALPSRRSGCATIETTFNSSFLQDVSPSLSPLSPVYLHVDFLSIPVNVYFFRVLFNWLVWLGGRVSTYHATPPVAQ